MKLIVFSCIVIGDLHVFSSYQKNSHYFAENLLLTQGRRYIWSFNNAEKSNKGN